MDREARSLSGLQNFTRYSDADLGGQRVRLSRAEAQRGAKLAIHTCEATKSVMTCQACHRAEQRDQAAWPVGDSSRFWNIPIL